MASWLITGATGFVGRHVLDLLQARACASRVDADDSIVVLGRRCPAGLARGAASCRPTSTSPTGLARRSAAIAPDFVIHTAGRTPPAPDEVALPGELLGDDPPAQSSAGPEPAGPSDARRARRPSSGRFRRRTCRSRSHTLQSDRCLWPEQMAGHGRRPGRAAAAGGHRRAGCSTRSGPACPPPRPSASSPPSFFRPAPILCPWSPAISRPGATSSTCATRRGP